MGKVKLELPSWIAAALDAGATGRLTLELEITGGATTVDALLKDLVVNYPGFQQTVFNPDTGHFNEQLNIVLNDRLLTSREVMQHKLSDGDKIALIPIYAGG